MPGYPVFWRWGLWTFLQHDIPGNLSDMVVGENMVSLGRTPPQAVSACMDWAREGAWNRQPRGSFIALLFRAAPKNHLGTRPRMCRRGLLQSSARPPKVGSLLKATTGKQPTATSPISLAFGSLGVRVCWMRHWSSHGRQCADHAARLLHASQLA